LGTVDLAISEKDLLRVRRADLTRLQLDEREQQR
jgi:hypothetical protein